MSSIDLISMAIRNLFKRKLRTFLTVLGVIVGTGAIIIMISLGIAMNDSFQEQLDNMGDILKIQVYNPNYYNAGGANKNAKDTTITKAVIENMKTIQGVKAVTPVMSDYWKFQSGKYIMGSSVTGIDPATMEDFGYKLAKGRLLDEGDATQLNLVFGGDSVFWFAKGRTNWNMEEEKEEPDVNVLESKINMSYDYNLGEKIVDESAGKIDVYKAKAVGLLERGDENAYTVFMPLNQMEKIKNDQIKKNKEKRNDSGYECAYVKCVDIDAVEAVVEELKSMGFEVYSAIDAASSMKEIAGSLQMLLGAIGGVSLFIAAIGITNTMIMSIYERTKEIGIMKVIGASLSDIKKLFLIEAILIGFFGGIFGVLISLGASAVLNNVGISFLESMQSSAGGKVSTIPVWLCFAALAFSSIIGLISGYFPARKAMKLSALSALKKD